MAHSPIYTHDCEACTYITTKDGKDIYTCGRSIVVRHSDEPSDNSSLPRKMAEMVAVQHPDCDSSVVVALRHIIVHEYFQNIAK